MANVMVFYDRAGNTLTAWLGDPQDECFAQEKCDEVVLMQNRDGHVIGFEKFNFSVLAPEHLRFAFETVSQ